MDPENIKEIIEKARSDQSPIFYGSVRFSITTNRKEAFFVAKKIVMKGSIKEILKDRSTKIAVIKSHLDGDKKKSFAFDLTRINLKAVEIKKFLGYGIK